MCVRISPCGCSLQASVITALPVSSSLHLVPLFLPLPLFLSLLLCFLVSPVFYLHRLRHTHTHIRRRVRGESEITPRTHEYQAGQIKRRLPGIIRSVARRGARTNQAASLFPAPELAFLLFFPPPLFLSFFFRFLFISLSLFSFYYSATIGANRARDAVNRGGNEDSRRSSSSSEWARILFIDCS